MTNGLQSGIGIGVELAHERRWVDRHKYDPSYLAGWSQCPKCGMHSISAAGWRYERFRLRVETHVSNEEYLYSTCQTCGYEFVMECYS